MPGKLSLRFANMEATGDFEKKNFRRKFARQYAGHQNQTSSLGKACKRLSVDNPSMKFCYEG